MNLMNVLPDYYYENQTMIELQNILSECTDYAEKSLNMVIDESFINSADQTISRRETILGINNQQEKPKKFRQERIRAKLLGQGTSTVAFIKGVAEQYSNGDVNLVEHTSQYLIEIEFIGTVGLPPNMEDLKKTLKEIIPAHLKIEYIYIFNTHGSVGTFKHSDLTQYTHWQICNTKLKSQYYKMFEYTHEELAACTHLQLRIGEYPYGN